MLRRTSRQNDYLFSSHSLRDLLEERRGNLQREVEQMEPNRLLNTAPADLSKYLFEKYSLDVPVLRREDWSVQETETQVDVRHDQGRWIRDRSRAVLIPGQRIIIEVPFEGDSELFYMTASTYSSSPPTAIVRSGAVLLSYELPHDTTTDIRPAIDRTLDDIEKHLVWLKSDVDAYMRQLPTVADSAIAARRTRILANQGRVASLGIPLKARQDSLKTYAVPEVRKKVVPTLPPASKEPYEPEPTLDRESYEHILNVIQNMTHVMERSPTAFQTMGEEDLRQHYLVQLNGHFEGNATGETFNVRGKTDILIRATGRNIFIAECKFWKGPKHYRETIDQLLGYTAWRDTKSAILIFNRGTSMTTVLNGIKTESEGHPNFKRSVNWTHESGFRYIFRQNNDTNRELTLTVLAFDVPAPE